MDAQARTRPVLGSPASASSAPRTAIGWRQMESRSDLVWNGAGLHHQSQAVQDLVARIWGTADNLPVRARAWQHNCRTQPPAQTCSTRDSTVAAAVVARCVRRAESAVSAAVRRGRHPRPSATGEHTVRTCYYQRLPEKASAHFGGA